ENIDGRLYKHQIYGEWFGIKSVKLLDWDMDDDLDIFATASSGIFDDTEDEVILYENLDGENFLNWRLSDNVDYADDLEYTDLDKDGDMDIIVSAKNANNVVWLKNEGFAANWEEDTLFTLADEPTGIAVGYLNADTLPDLVVCSQNDGMLYALINDTSQIFLPINLDSNVNGPMEVETGDVDNDGDTDIVLAADDGSNSVVIYTNEGGLNFSKEIIHTQDQAQDLELMYWNADSILDIFVAFDASDVGLLGFISNGSGYDIDTFEVGNDRLLSLKAADMDEDGSLDLISGHNKGNSVLSTAYLSFIQNGSISSSLPLNNNLSDEITSIDVGDVNGDGQLDIVYTDFDNDNLILITLDSLGMATSLPKDLASLAKLDMYPNPAQDQVQLSLESQLSLHIEAICIYDLQGRKIQVAVQNLSDTQMLLDVSSLSEGIYILQVNTELGSLSEKIEIRRN
ncbi:MAG: T9SS type A sorting domain-containing protein, partial [Bacteroidota bacterium]